MLNNTFFIVDRGDSQSKLDLPVFYNLHDELKKILQIHKRDRIIACADQTAFQFAFSCFHNYEVKQTV